jgi:uncharacterized membrane protein
MNDGLKIAAAGATTFVVMLALDLIWLGVVAKATYRQGIGHLMADRPDIAVAAIFYVVYATGLTVFALVPHAAHAGLGKTLTSAALFGFFAYATYDLTNLATLRNWPLQLTLIDIAWGTVVSAVSATAGKYLLDRLSPAMSWK